MNNIDKYICLPVIPSEDILYPISRRKTGDWEAGKKLQQVAACGAIPPCFEIEEAAGQYIRMLEFASKDHIAIPINLFREMVEIVSGAIDDEGSEIMRKIRKLESEHERS